MINRWSDGVVDLTPLLGVIVSLGVGLQSPDSSNEFAWPWIIGHSNGESAKSCNFKLGLGLDLDLSPLLQFKNQIVAEWLKGWAVDWCSL